MATDFEVVEFLRPDGNSKNLFISGIPSMEEEELLDVLHRIFSKYGPVFSIQSYPIALKYVRTVSEPDTCTIEKRIVEKSAQGASSNTENDQKPVSMGYYAFVTFFMSSTARKAKDMLKSRIIIKSTECKVGFAQRKKELVDGISQRLHFIKCEELANCCLGYNGWTSSIKMLDSEVEEQENKMFKVNCVCIVKLSITAGSLSTEGMGAWEEVYSLADPSSRAKAVCKSKKLSYQRAVEDAFSRVILVVFSNGNVWPEINTTKPELRLGENVLPDEPVIKVNNLDLDPDDVLSDSETLCQSGDVDDMNVQILQELEDEI